MTIHKMPDPRGKSLAQKNETKALKLLMKIRDEMKKLGWWSGANDISEDSDRISFLRDKQLYIESAIQQLEKPGYILPFPANFSNEGLKFLSAQNESRGTEKQLVELVDQLYNLCLDDPFVKQRSQEQKKFEEKSLKSQAAKNRHMDNVNRKIKS